LGAAAGAEGAVELMEDVPLKKQINVEVRTLVTHVHMPVWLVVTIVGSRVQHISS
jgi:hypothetical protein